MSLGLLEFHRVELLFEDSGLVGEDQVEAQMLLFGVTFTQRCVVLLEQDVEVFLYLVEASVFVRRAELASLKAAYV